MLWTKFRNNKGQLDGTDANHHAFKDMLLNMGYDLVLGTFQPAV